MTAERPIRFGLRAQLMARVALLVLAVTAGTGFLWIVSETVNRHALLVKDGELLAQTLASTAARVPPERSQGALQDLFTRAATRFDVEDVAVVDAEGRVIAAHDPRRLGERIDAGRLSLHGATEGPGAVLERILAPVSVEVTAPIVAGGEPRGFVDFRFRSEEVVREAQATVRSILLVLGFFLVVGVGLAALFVSRITRPLVALAGAAHGLGEGATVPVDASRRDEVWLLAERLNAMSRGLRERGDANARLLEDLRELNRGLETRVERATRDLRAARDTLSAIVGSVEEAILTVDAGGRILTTNRATEKLLGVREAGLVGRGLAAEIAPSEASAALEEALRAAADGAATQALELEGPKSQSGEARALEADVAPILPFPGSVPAADGDGHGIRAVVTVRDRTQQKKLEAAMRRADRLSSLATISGSLTHELGNYANVIRGYSTALLRDLKPASRASEDVAAIRRVNEQAIRLLERFALFARPHAPPLASHPPAALIADAAALLEPRLREQGIELVRDDAEELPALHCNASLLVQAFFNVLLNGAQAMAGPGRITVTGRAAGGRVVLEFRDAGCGIAPEALPHVFDPFFTTKPEGEGTGLGLAIVDRVVELHGGRVSIESAVGRGTTVRIELPAAAGGGGEP